MIKNVCHYTAQMEYTGGIESVIRRLISIFSIHGIECWTVCEKGSPVGFAEGTIEVFSADITSRLSQWDAFLAKHPTDVVIIHHTISPILRQEIIHLHARGIKCIQVRHSSFPSGMMLRGEEKWWNAVLEIGRLVDLTVTVSELDAQWWQALGIRAANVQNPFITPSKNVETIRRDGEDGAANLLWVGRLCEQKQPKAALAAFALAVKECPEITLTMVGGTPQGNRQMLREAKRLKVENKVTFVDARHDIEDLWLKADIHYLTSITESFCLVIAEAKAHGIPTIMFDIPFLELTKSGAGVVKVRQGDINGMKDAIISLANSAMRRCELGSKARESLSAFNDNIVWNSWNNAFNVLCGDTSLPVVSEVNRLMAEQVYLGWNRYCDKNLWAVRMAENWELLTGTSLCFIACILDKIVIAVRGLKAMYRRVK